MIPIKQLFHGISSAFTKIPIPHNVNSKDTGAGKTYLLSHVAEYFPNKYVLPLTIMSDKAIFHRPGVMVIEKIMTKPKVMWCLLFRCFKSVVGNEFVVK